jgi:uncharacterized protein YeaC (DUF1315 family)
MMHGIILLNHSENTRRVEDEEKSRFLRGLIAQMFEDVPEVVSKIDEIWIDETSLTVEQKVKMRQFMNTYGLQVIDDGDGNMKVYLDGQVVGEWFKSKYKLKQDLSQIDRKKQFYLEMEVNCWSVFESTEETQETQEMK